MMTKQQEREALERIKNILADAGADSYIGMALAGCVEDAESNIENDWALSMAGRWQSAEQKLEAVKAEADGLRAEREVLRAELDRCNARIAELTEAARLPPRRWATGCLRRLAWWQRLQRWFSPTLRMRRSRSTSGAWWSCARS